MPTIKTVLSLARLKLLPGGLGLDAGSAPKRTEKARAKDGEVREARQPVFSALAIPPGMPALVLLLFPLYPLDTALRRGTKEGIPGEQDAPEPAGKARRPRQGLVPTHA